jgi:UDP-N-acetyl-D-mannosaminuronic acid transferase (WecB/TagA/CpsF family)
MYGATFDFIAARAARYPVIMRRSQLHKTIRSALGPKKTGDTGCRWLLLNTMETNQFLKGTG